MWSQTVLLKIIKTGLAVFHWINACIQVWQDIRMSKWQNCHLWENFPFKGPRDFYLSVIDWIEADIYEWKIVVDKKKAGVTQTKWLEIYMFFLMDKSFTIRSVHVFTKQIISSILIAYPTQKLPGKHSHLSGCWPLSHKYGNCQSLFSQSNQWWCVYSSEREKEK